VTGDNEFQQLRGAIEASPSDPSKKADALTKVKALEETKGAVDYSSKLKDFMAISAT
jgi:hypothetical protein